MKRILLSLIAIAVCFSAYAQQFADYFMGEGLRIDLVFAGNVDTSRISLHSLTRLPVWAGRTHNLDKVPLKGNGDITVSTPEGTVIYKTSFSTLYQEWLSTEEAKHLNRAFENSFLIPYPKQPVRVTVCLYDNRNELTARQSFDINPTDILVRRITAKDAPHKVLYCGAGDDNKIDVAILAEGYTMAERAKFYRDARAAVESILAAEPFKSSKEHFRFVAVAAPSDESGVSIPHKNEWKASALASHFDTFYGERYLTAPEVWRIFDCLGNIPFEHIVILANTDTYGGGGIYNSYTLTTAHHKMFRPVVVHEFGHSFGGLADEYFYEQDFLDQTYTNCVEPWEQNITAMIDFDSKWKDMVPAGVQIPTPVSQKDSVAVGAFEGAGYKIHGMWRPSFDCRMRTNQAEGFCPVCRRAVQRVIDFYTE